MDTSKVTEMRYMFNRFVSLKYLSFTSKWNNSKVKYKYNIINESLSLSFIPEISDGKYEYFELSKCLNCLNRPIVDKYNLFMMKIVERF